MVSLTIDIEQPTREDLANDLDRIASLLRQGYFCRVDPAWSTSGIDEGDEELEPENE